MELVWEVEWAEYIVELILGYGKIVDGVIVWLCDQGREG